MTKTMQAARGASAYTQPDFLPYSPKEQPARLYGVPDGDTPTNTWAQLIDELFVIRNLQDDWDGEGTEAPPRPLVDWAIILAQYLQSRGEAPADRVIAGVNGTVYFEWHTPLGYQEIEVTSPVDAESRWVAKGSDVTEVVYLSRRS